jgi:hypothetical protein
MKSRGRVNSTVDMADSRQAAIVVLLTRFRVGAACLGSWHWPTQIRMLVPQWRMAPVVEALQALRGDGGNHGRGDW